MNVSMDIAEGLEYRDNNLSQAMLKYLALKYIKILKHCRDIEILSWFSAESVLPHGEKVPYQLWLDTLLIIYHDKNTLWGRCFITLTRVVPQHFPLGFLNLILFLDQLRLA